MIRVMNRSLVTTIGGQKGAKKKAAYFCTAFVKKIKTAKRISASIGIQLGHCFMLVEEVTVALNLMGEAEEVGEDPWKKVSNDWTTTINEIESLIMR
jgi:hypothetical protein